MLSTLHVKILFTTYQEIATEEFGLKSLWRKQNEINFMESSIKKKYQSNLSYRTDKMFLKTHKLIKAFKGNN